MKASSTAGTVVTGVLRLSIGSSIVQGLSFGGQLVFVVWLTPVDYGYWATASAALFIVSGLVNFGEVSGFLAAPNADPRLTRAAIRRINLVLVLVGLLIAYVYFIRVDTYVATLIVVLSLNIPLLGESNFLYAAAVRRRSHRSLVSAQVANSVARISIGVIVAWATGSALAFAVSFICYTGTMVAWGRNRGWADFGDSEATVGPEGWAEPRRPRFAWGFQSLAQTLPTQADYFVVSLISTQYAARHLLLRLSVDGRY